MMALLTGGGLATLGGLLSGLVSNWLGGRRDKRRYNHEVKQATDRHVHERHLAYEQRRHDRVVRTYEEVTDLTGRVAIWAAFTRQIIEIAGSPKPALPTLEEQAHVESLLSIHGSSEIQKRFREWQTTVQELAAYDMLLKTEEPDTWQQIQHIKPKIDRQRNELAIAIAEELNQR